MTEERGNPPVPGEPSNAVLSDSRPTPAHDTRSDDRDPLELHQIQTHEDDEIDSSAPSASSGDDYRMTTRRTTSRQISQRELEGRNGLWSRICRAWNRHVTLIVPQKSNRDYFALERTFLGYIRTSTVFAMQGVLVAQLFRLQQTPGKFDHLTFYDVATPLSVACHGIAIVIALVGAIRFWRQQFAISRGKVYSGGWEVNTVAILLFCLVLVTLVLTVIILIQINLSPPALVRRILRS